jgi:geranylgeranyl pyrophosphate synthase
MTIRNIDSSPNIESLLQATELFMFQAIGQTKAKSISVVMRYHIESGGARVRARLALHTGLALNLEKKIIVALSACCELVHNASLLHDDIQDGDEMRRGRMAAWFKFDINSAMCAGTLMLSAAYKAVSEVTVYSPQLIAHLHQRTSDLISGQVIDVTSSASVINVTTYLDMAKGKSGSLLALPLELVMISANEPTALPFAKVAGESFAVAYQIADDMSDLQADLANSRTNIVSILENTGVTRPEALARARLLAEEHLKFATEYAAKLPANSGAYFIKLCETLKEKFDTSHSSRIENV